MDCLLLPFVFPKLLFNNSKAHLYNRSFLSSLNTKTNAKKLSYSSLSLKLSLSLVVKFIPMEKSLLSSELISFIILETILSFFTRFLKLSKRFLSFPSRSSKATKTQLRAGEARGDAEVLIMREEVELVMERMGLKMTGNEKGEPKLKEFMGMEEVVAMFDDKEPSLEEVKEAFAVFDENGDGFVDAVELQRVLCKLGFEGMGLDSCREMIGAHDENGDGKIDFGEFVKFMESSLC